MNSEEIAGALLRGRAGAVDAGETWGGLVTIKGDIVVPEGATLRIAAGARVVFTTPSTAIVVFGELSIEGTPELPVSVGGPVRWAGITVMPGGRAALRHAMLKNAETGLLLTGDGGEFEDLTIDECENGVYAPVGRHRFVRYRGPAIVFEEQAKVELDSRPLTATRPKGRKGSFLQRLVLRTQDVPVLLEFYRALYFLGELSFGALARVSGNVVSCGVWRGVKRGDFRAGISDLDFLVVARALPGASGKAWLAGFWRRHALLKRVAPFLGETFVSLEPELVDFLEHGGVRAPELAAALRRPLPGPFAEPKRQIAAWTECAHSYGRLLEWLWHRNDEPWAVRRVQVFKSAVDVLRHLPSTGKTGLSRKEFWAVDPRDELRYLLEPHPPRGSADALPAELWACVLRSMNHASEEEAAWEIPKQEVEALRFVPAPPRAPAGEYGANLERWNSSLLRYTGPFGAGVTGALFSDLYPSYAILENSEMTKLGLADALRRCAAAKPSGGLTFLLSRGLWNVWSRLPFAENPLQFMDAATSCAGRLVPVRSQFAWGNLDVPPPPPAVLLESARQAWTQLRLSRRWLGSPAAGVNGRYATHYLLSRAMGLRLLTQRRIAVPFFDLDHLSKVYLREFPDAAPALAAIRPESGARSVDESYWACHDFLESALAEPMR